MVVTTNINTGFPRKEPHISHQLPVKLFLTSHMNVWFDARSNLMQREILNDAA